MSATAHTGPYPQIVGTVTRMPKRVRPPKHARIRVKLDTVMGVAREMGRLIRLSYNGHLPAEELTRYIFALDKLRACLESAVAIEADAIANAPAVPSTVHISIGTVPSGSYFTKEAAEQLHNGTLLLENENAVSVEDYTRAVSSRRADDELNAAIDAAAPGQLHEPIEADVADNNGFRRQSTVLAEPAPSPTPEVIVPPPPLDQNEIDRANGFEFSRPYDQHRRPQIIPPRKTQRPRTEADFKDMSLEELMRRAGVSSRVD